VGEHGTCAERKIAMRGQVAKESQKAKTFHTEFAEYFNIGVMEPLDHRGHEEHRRSSPWSLCLISVPSVRNSFAVSRPLYDVQNVPPKVLTE
jgi:hypothetical protein